MEQFVNQNSEFFVFLKREFGDKPFSPEELERMYLAYIAGKYGIPKQVPAVLKPIDFNEKPFYLGGYTDEAQPINNDERDHVL